MSVEYALSPEGIFYNRNISALKYRLKQGTWREKMPVYAVYKCLLRLLTMAEDGPGEKKSLFILTPCIVYLSLAGGVFSSLREVRPPGLSMFLMLF